MKSNFPVPPPVLMLLLFIISALLASVAPIPKIVIPFQTLIALIFIIAGIGCSVAGFFAFKQSRTPVKPGAEPSVLVVSGPYQFTRNPMYLGILLFSIGCLFAFQSLWFLVPPVLFFLIMNFLQIPFEEQLLRARFGQPYDVYCQRVRRWI